MAINFPTALDTITNPTATDYLNSPSHAGQHADANDAIEAIQAKLGINASAVTTSHDYKLSGVTGTDKAASLTGTEALSNKTLTSPSINGGTLTGEVNMGENAGMALDNALSADGKYSGIVIGGTAGAALAFGDLCYFDPTDSRWELADANIAAGADGDPRGRLGLCVLAAAGDGSATKMLLWGTISAATAFPALTINAPAYVGEIAGDIVVTQPTTADVVIRVVGFAVTGDDLFFNPSPDYITHV